MSSTHHESSQSSIDFKSRGLGWIPDYPDKRDYYLECDEVHQQGHLRREESTRSTEEIAKYIIDDLSNSLDKVLNVLKEKTEISDSQWETVVKEVKAKKKDFRKRIFGGITFKATRLHKVLRRGTKGNHVLKLKAYMSILGHTGKLTEPESDTVLTFNQFCGIGAHPSSEHLTWFYSWINDSTFDEDTEYLVRAFQTGSGIEVDGIVGLESYMHLSWHLARTSNSGTFRNRDDIRLTSIPSLLSAADSALLVDRLTADATQELRHVIQSLNPSLMDLKQRCMMLRKDIDQNFQESTLADYRSRLGSLVESVTSVLQSIFEVGTIPTSRRSTYGSGANYIFYEKFFAPLIPALPLKYLLQSNSYRRQIEDLSDQDTFEEAIATLVQTIDLLQTNEWLQNQTKDRQFDHPDHVSKLFSTDSTIVEPIVSILLRLVCPLTCYRKISAALIDGLAVLSILLPVRESRHKPEQELCPYPLPNPAHVREVAVRSQMPNIASQFRNLPDSDIRALQTMAINGLQKTRENFLKGVGYVVRDAGSQWTDYLESVLLVYFIVKTFIRRFASYLPDDAIAEFNEFSKTELFEIQDQDTVFDQCDTELSLFAPPRLTIPINDNLEIAKIGKCQKRYFFLPGVVDLSFWCSPIEDQGTIQSCAALAGISLLEYFANRSHEGYTDVSALFLYKAARNLMHVSGDVGASLRETMKAMTIFGVPPEKYWPYDCDRADVEPPPFCYAFAQNYQALKYFRLDYSGISEDSLLFQIKAVLASGFPCMFGFTIYMSAYEDINVQRGVIPLPGYNDRVLGGHAVVAVGYSDYETIDSSGDETLSRGAFLIRNSWGKGWGRDGYGWLPYDYVLHGLTADWWSLLKAEWFKDDSFGLGGRATGGRYPLF